MFNLNTNIQTLNAKAQGTFTQNALNTSLERLSSGLRINKAADDASGLAIADSLRNQSHSLTQAIRNANDSIGLIQVADKAMAEQINILDTIKTKSIQAAQDGQTTKTRTAIQADINRLIYSLDNIAQTTSYNGQSLLSGSFTNKEFQIGAYSHQSVKLSIGATSSDKIGHARFETTYITAMGEIQLEFMNGNEKILLEKVTLSTSGNTGLGVLADVINKNSDRLGVRASYEVTALGHEPILAGSIENFTINGVNIGNVTFKANDADGSLLQAINSRKEETGVHATVTETGALVLKTTDGRGMHISATGIQSNDPNITDLQSLLNVGGSFNGNFNVIDRVGRITLVKHDSSDIVIANKLGGGIAGNITVSNSRLYEQTVVLRDVLNEFNIDIRSAIGATHGFDTDPIAIPLTHLLGAMAVMDIAESAIKHLDAIRSDLGSVQQQIQSTFNNITITQVNVKAAESNIRETDFAEESSIYNKLNILAQSGSYAMVQSNVNQQNILKLLA